jgi:hypothetical protein
MQEQLTDTGNTYIVNSNKYGDIFKTFWQGINENYVYWELEPTGYWDEMYNKYKPLFTALGTYTPGVYDATYYQATTYISEMVAPLKDGHLSIAFESWDPVINPGDYTPRLPARVDRRYENNPDDNPWYYFWNNKWINEDASCPPLVSGTTSQWNYFEKLIRPTYFSGDTECKIEIAKDDTGNPTGFHIATAKQALSGGGYILYLGFNMFAVVTNCYKGGDGEAVPDTSNKFGQLMQQYTNDVMSPNCKAVIFDLRGNRGGANVDIALLLGRLITSDLYFGYMRTKKGVNRLDYAPWADYFIKANPPELRAANAGKMPVVALVNDASYSCGEIMPAAIRYMPGGYLVGTQTYGATGPRIGNNNPAGTFGGSWQMNKFIENVTEAGLQLKGRNGENYEGVGIPPNEVVPFDSAEFIKGHSGGGTDNQLQAALNYIKGRPLP